jgi:hypothetical protein
MIDLQKAFDTLDKTILLDKLYKVGIRGKMLNIILSYLTNRKCCVKIDNEFSDWCDVLYGVPQGSILGPLLFLIYINDINDYEWNSYVTLYADDIFMLSIHWDKIQNLQNDFDHINDYFVNNELYINIEKTCFMPVLSSHMYLENVSVIAHIGSCNKRSDCKCKKIATVNQAKYLGLLIDRNWKFYHHVDKLMVKIRQAIPIIYRVKNLLNWKNKKLIYEACILSNIRYGCVIYGTTSSGLIDRLQKLLNKAAKILFRNERNKKATNEILRENKIFTIDQIINYTILIKNYFNETFKTPIKRCVRNNNNWLIEPRWNNSYGKRGNNYLIPHIFNKLPTTLRYIKNVNTVKTGVKKWFFQK